MVNKRLLFLHRVLFLANLAFLACVILRRTHWLNQLPDALKGGIALLGWVMAPILSVVGLLALLWSIYKGSVGYKHWLYFVNLVLAVVQVLVLFF